MAGSLATTIARLGARAPLVPVAVAFSLGVFLAESGGLPIWLALLSAAFFFWQWPFWVGWAKPVA